VTVADVTYAQHESLDLAIFEALGGLLDHAEAIEIAARIERQGELALPPASGNPDKPHGKGAPP
jgi:hypothetical protein